MKYLCFLLLIFTVCSAYSQTGAVYELPQGRKILLDGFLPDWREDQAKVSPQNEYVFWDAVSTSEGLAGYIRIPVTDSCPGESLRVLASVVDSVETELFEIGISFNSTEPWDETTAFHRADTYYTAEFIFGDLKAPLDRSLPLFFSCTLQDSCGERNHILSAQLSPVYKETGIFSGKIVFQLISIVILLAGFIFLQIRVRRKNTVTRTLPQGDRDS